MTLDLHFSGLGVGRKRRQGIATHSLARAAESWGWHFMGAPGRNPAKEWLMVLVTEAVRTDEREGTAGRLGGQAGIRYQEQCSGNCLHCGPNWFSLEVIHVVGLGS